MRSSNLKYIMMQSLALFSLVLVTLPLHVVRSADIYRCVSDAGVVTYSDQPCGKSADIVFKKYEMGIDDAAQRDILKIGTDHSNRWSVDENIKDHARRIAQIIVPNQHFHHIYLVRKGEEGDEIPIDWQIKVPWGPEEDPLNSRIEFHYSGKRNGRLKVWLKSLKFLSDRRPYDPPAMQGVRCFKKSANGKWKYTP